MCRGPGQKGRLGRGWLEGALKVCLAEAPGILCLGLRTMDGSLEGRHGWAELASNHPPPRRGPPRFSLYLLVDLHTQQRPPGLQEH